MKVKKFATQMDAEVLKEMRSFARETDRKISTVLTEAVRDYLNKNRVRTAFRSAMDEVLSENQELLKRLAK